MATAEDFRDMTVTFHAYQASQGIVYTEAFLSPSLCVERIVWPDLFEALRDGLAEGREHHAVEVRFIPDIIARNLPDTKRRVLQLTLAGQRGIRCLEDPGLVEELRERRVPIEGLPAQQLQDGHRTRGGPASHRSDARRGAQRHHQLRRSFHARDVAHARIPLAGRE